MPLSDIVNKHLTYTYGNGWKYEFWFKSEKRIVYAIHSGMMAGRKNYQACDIQEVRTGEIFQVSWFEETGTIVSIVVDLVQQRNTTYAAFSRGHWDNPEKAHGDKRNPADFERWRTLSELGKSTDRVVLSEQATIHTITEGRGELEDVDEDAETI